MQPQWYGATKQRKGIMGSIFIVVSVKTGRRPFVCNPNLAPTKINRGRRERAKWTRRVVRSESAAGVAQAGQGACGACALMTHGGLSHVSHRSRPGSLPDDRRHGTAHGTALFAAHFVHFCTSLPHPPHSRTPR